MMGGRSVFFQCVEYSNRSTMDVGAMQECDAMDGEGTRISLQRSEMMQIRLSEPIFRNEKNDVHDEQRSGRLCGAGWPDGP